MKKGMVARILSAAIVAVLAIAPISAMTVDAATVTDKSVSTDAENVIGSQKIDEEYGELLALYMGYDTFSGYVTVIEGNETTITVDYDDCGLTLDDIWGVEVYEMPIFYTTEAGDLEILQCADDNGIGRNYIIGSAWYSSYEYGCSWSKGSISGDGTVKMTIEEDKAYIVRYIYYNDDNDVRYVDRYIVSDGYESSDLTAKYIEDVSSDGTSAIEKYLLYTESGDAYLTVTGYTYGSSYIAWDRLADETDHVLETYDSIHTIKLLDGVVEEEVEEEVETKVINIEEYDGVISEEMFAEILELNQEYDIVIESTNGVTFTFSKGEMTAVEGKTEYDFGTTITREYNTSMPSYVTESVFVCQIDYNYSGMLPGEAEIRFYVGTMYEEGQVFYYSLMHENGYYAETQAAIVDADGYVTVVQDHCSSYVVTTEDPSATEDSSEDAVPETGDTTNAFLYTLIMLVMMGMGVVTYKKVA